MAVSICLVGISLFAAAHFFIISVMYDRGIGSTLGTGYLIQETSMEFNKTLAEMVKAFSPAKQTSNYQTMRGDVELNELVAGVVFGKNSKALGEKRVASQQAPAGRGCMKLIEIELQFMWSEMKQQDNHPRIATYTKDILEQDLAVGSAVIFNLGSATTRSFTYNELAEALTKLSAKGILPIINIEKLDPDYSPDPALEIVRGFVDAGGEAFIAVSFADFYLSKQRMGFIFRTTENAEVRSAMETHMAVAARRVISSPSLCGVEPLKNSLKNRPTRCAETVTDIGKKFENLKAQLSSYVKKLPTDPILGLNQKIQQMVKDGFKLKLNAIVGVLKKKDGTVGVPDAFGVAAGDERFLDRRVESLTTLGHVGFLKNAAKLVLGEDLFSKVSDRYVAVQTYGGTGGLVLTAHAILQYEKEQNNNLEPVIYIADPVWPNTKNSFESSGFKRIERYKFFNIEEYKKTDWLSQLQNIEDGAYFVIDGSCQNPTGIYRSEEEIDKFITICKAKNVTVIVDSAYQGFGRGFEEDGSILRKVTERLPRCFIDTSFSKNAGGYGYRLGHSMFIAKNQAEKKVWQSIIEKTADSLWGTPPEYFAALTSFVVKNPNYLKSWMEELTQGREKLQEQRRKIAQLLVDVGFDPQVIKEIVQDGQGMFVLLPKLSQEASERLLNEFGVAILQDGSGRCTIAAFTEDAHYQVLETGYRNLLAA